MLGVERFDDLGGEFGAEQPHVGIGHAQVGKNIAAAPDQFEVAGLAHAPSHGLTCTVRSASPAAGERSTMSTP